MVAFWLLALSLCVPSVAVGTQKPVHIKNVLVGDFSIDVDAKKQTIDIAPKSAGGLPESKGSQGDETCETCKAVVDMMKKIAAQPRWNADDIRVNAENLCYDTMPKKSCRSVAKELHRTSANNVIHTLRDQTVSTEVLCARFNMCLRSNDAPEGGESLIDLGQMLRRRAKLNAGHGATKSKTATFDEALSRKALSRRSDSDTGVPEEQCPADTKAHIGFLIDVSRSIKESELKIVGQQLWNYINGATSDPTNRLYKVSIFAYSSVLYQVVDGACVGAVEAGCPDPSAAKALVQSKLSDFNTANLKRWIGDQNDPVKVHSVMDYLAGDIDSNSSPQVSEAMSQSGAMAEYLVNYKWKNLGTMTKSSMMKASQLMDKVHHEDRQHNIVMQSILTVFTDGMPFTSQLHSNKYAKSFNADFRRWMENMISNNNNAGGGNLFKKLKTLSRRQESRSSSEAAARSLVSAQENSCVCHAGSQRHVRKVPKTGFLVPLKHFTKDRSVARIAQYFPDFKPLVRTTRRGRTNLNLHEISDHLDDVLDNACQCARPVHVHIAFDGSYSMRTNQFATQMRLVKDLVTDINSEDVMAKTFLYQYGPGVQQHFPPSTESDAEPSKEYWSDGDDVSKILEIAQMGNGNKKGTCSYGAISNITNQIAINADNGDDSGLDVMHVVVFMGDGAPWKMGDAWQSDAPAKWWDDKCRLDDRGSLTDTQRQNINGIVGALKDKALAILAYKCGGGNSEKPFFDSIKSTSWPSETGTCTFDEDRHGDMKNQIKDAIHKSCVMGQHPGSCCST